MDLRSEQLKDQQELVGDARFAELVAVNAKQQSAISNQQSAVSNSQPVNPKSKTQNPKSIELHIEELIVDGFTPDNRERFVVAVETELVRMLNEKGIEHSLTENMEIERITGSAFRLKPDEPSETAGRHLAKAIYKGMTGGMRG